MSCATQAGGAILNSSAGNSAPANVLPQQGGYMPNEVPFIENAAPFGSGVGGWRKKISRNGYTRGAHTRRAYSSKGHNIVRKATVRKSRVPTSNITDRGARGKWREVNKSNGIEINHPGSLSSMGYSVVNKPASRHSSLRRIIKKFGPTATFRKLQAVGTFTKRTSKGRSIKFLADRNWVKKKYM